jgi:hypothetical protein
VESIAEVAVCGFFDRWDKAVGVALGSQYVSICRRTLTDIVAPKTMKRL